jgi:hypothetical protein
MKKGLPSSTPDGPKSQPMITGIGGPAMESRADVEMVPDKYRPLASCFTSYRQSPTTPCPAGGFGLSELMYGEFRSHRVHRPSSKAGAAVDPGPALLLLDPLDPEPDCVPPPELLGRLVSDRLRAASSASR